jgi:hypothetical protein
MAILPYQQLFVWSDIEELGDLERLRLVLKVLPDEELMQKLERIRGRSGVDKYPIRAVWNSIIAGIVFQHPTIESLRRELKRNPLLRQLCGFNLFFGNNTVPGSSCYSRFFRRLGEHTKELEEIFQSLVSICYQELPGFGESLAIDGKAIESYASRPGNHSDDRRGDHDAKWGKHVTKCKNSAGTLTEHIKTWFGYTLHLIVDTRYELPVEFTVLPASENEMPVAHRLIDRMADEYPERLEGCDYLCGDRGYDDGKLHKKLWDHYGIKPIIDIRRSWRDGEPTRAYDTASGVVYTNTGEVFCVAPYTNIQKKMAHRGFEKDRNCLKYRCPARHYGLSCPTEQFCTLPPQVRIPLKEDRRIFSPVARDSYKWQKLYNRRSAVERVNSRIDTMFGFEHHTIRGQKKMSLRVTLAFMVMSAFAVGKVRSAQPSELRRFVTAS